MFEVGFDLLDFDVGLWWPTLAVSFGSDFFVEVAFDFVVGEVGFDFFAVWSGSKLLAD